MKEVNQLPGFRGIADESWLQFYEECMNCRACGLAETRNKVVVGRGSLQAPLLILGEGPGAEEDRQGLPFVGRSGRLLSYLLEGAGFTTADYHIANIVKCRPPENRVPTRDEIQNCRSLLLRQFSCVGCRVVLTLGSTAFQAFTGLKEPITRARGHWLFCESENLWILPSLHPAYILRNDRQRPNLWSDLLLARLQLGRLGALPPLEHFPAMPTGQPPRVTP